MVILRNGATNPRLYPTPSNLRLVLNTPRNKNDNISNNNDNSLVVTGSIK